MKLAKHNLNDSNFPLFSLLCRFLLHAIKVYTHLLLLKMRKFLIFFFKSITVIFNQSIHCKSNEKVFPHSKRLLILYYRIQLCREFIEQEHEEELVIELTAKKFSRNS